MDEYQKNLERGKKGKWLEYGLKPFSGPFHDIDMHQEWYCPSCQSLNAKLILSKDQLELYCNHNIYECEYSYCNKEGRDQRQYFVSSGFRYPMTIRELNKAKLKSKQQALAALSKNINNLQQDIEQLKTDISELESKTKDVKNEQDS